MKSATWTVRPSASPWPHAKEKPPTGSFVYLWVYGRAEKEAFVPLADWPVVGTDDPVPTSLVLLRGDRVLCGKQVEGKSGKFRNVVCLRRGGITGWVPAGTLRDEHPLQELAVLLRKDLAADAADETKKKSLTKAQLTAAAQEKAFNAKNCSTAASAVQNWMRAGGPLKPVASHQYADHLRTKGPTEKLIEYYRGQRGAGLMRRPESAPLWPGDLMLFSLPRHFDGERLVPLPYRTRTWLINEDAAGDTYTNTLDFTWSGHVMTFRGKKEDKGRTLILTIEGHAGTDDDDVKLQTEPASYDLRAFHYWGAHHWGLVPLTQRSDPTEAQMEKVWGTTWWKYNYHRSRTLQRSASVRRSTSADLKAKGDVATAALLVAGAADDEVRAKDHATRAQELWAAECRRRSRAEIPHEDVVEKSPYRDLAWSGLELYGFASWVE